MLFGHVLVCEHSGEFVAEALLGVALDAVETQVFDFIDGFLQGELVESVHLHRDVAVFGLLFGFFGRRAAEKQRRHCE